MSCKYLLNAYMLKNNQKVICSITYFVLRDVSLVLLLLMIVINATPAGNKVIVSSQADLQQASKIIEVS